MARSPRGCRAPVSGQPRPHAGVRCSRCARCMPWAVRCRPSCWLTGQRSSRVRSVVLTVPARPAAAHVPGANPRGEAMSITFPGESVDYRAARDRLLEQEIELRRATEAVAAARRALPSGGVVPEDYVFQGAGPDGAPTDVRLSELFAPGKDSLVIYSFMFPRDPADDRPGERDGPCPSCV